MGRKAIAVVAAMVLLPTGSPASAAYPGSNGAIAFDRFAGSDFDVYTMNPDGTRAGDVTRTDDNVQEYMPSFSADGTTITFVRSKGFTRQTDVWVMRSDGSEARRVTQTTDVSEAWPVFSPDGTRIAFIAGVNIEIADADGTNLSTLPTDPVYPARISWRPDGGALVYAVHTPAGGSALEEYDFGTDATRRLGPSRGFSYAPDYAPDGSELAYVRLRRQRFQSVRALALDGSSDREIYGETDRRRLLFTWAPDGNALAIQDETDLRLRLVSPTGQTLQNLGIVLADTTLTWQPCASDCTITGMRPSTTTIFGAFRVGGRVIVTTEVFPVHRGQRVEVTLFRKRAGKFRKVATKRPKMDVFGIAAPAFKVASKGRCKAVARFGGDEDHRASKDVRRFRCRGESAG